MTHRETFGAITELTGAALTIKGYHYEKGQPIPEGERKLYLLLEGPTELSVKRAKVRSSASHASATDRHPSLCIPRKEWLPINSCFQSVAITRSRQCLRCLPLLSHHQQSES